MDGTRAQTDVDESELFGIGLYTPVEAGRLLGLSSAKIRRWLSGHSTGGRAYGPLWDPQIDLQDGSVHLGFRDLMELRAAHEFMRAGISAQRIRRAIQIARDIVGDDRPLSTTRFRTDGRRVFLELAEEEKDPSLLDLFSGQYVLSKIVERSLRHVDFQGAEPVRWWVASKQNHIVVDPERSFGQPIDDESGVPTSILSAAAAAFGVERAAREWLVTPATVRRAANFESNYAPKAA